ncbi:hypothetical protein BGZ68_006140 [Mortierella alpina]|nr:hypothetical protein BGZ68_006140 [Mortierella alpina]
MAHLCLFCNLRPQGYRSIASLQSHILVVHDGGARLGVLTCQTEGCDVTYYSRVGYSKHKQHCRGPLKTPRKRTHHWSNRFTKNHDTNASQDLVAPSLRASAGRDEPEPHLNVNQEADACVEERSEVQHAVTDLDVGSRNKQLLASDLRPEFSAEVDGPLEKHSSGSLDENLEEHVDEHSGDQSNEHSAVNAKFATAFQQSAIAPDTESTAPQQILHEQATEGNVPEQSLRARPTESVDIQETFSTRQRTDHLALAHRALQTATASMTDLHSLVNGLLPNIVEPSCTGEPSSGMGTAVLTTPKSAKRRYEDPITLIRSNKKQTGQVARSALKDLGDALIKHPFGKLLKIDQYEPMEPNLFLSDVHSHGEDVAKSLAGSLLQSGSTIILIIRVEVFGRCTKKDVHGFKSVRPSWDLKEVKVVHHNNRRKLLIGTTCWNAIVTASINLISGDISVGVDNPTMRLLGQTRIWTRKDCALNPLLKKPLNNNVQHEGGLSLRAAMFHLFVDQMHLPLTICRGLNNGNATRNLGAEDAMTLCDRTATCSGNEQVQKILVDGGFTIVKAFDDGLVQASIRKTIDLLLHDRKGKARAYYH